MHIMRDVKDLRDLSHRHRGYHYTDGWGRSWRMRDVDIALSSALFGIITTLVIVWVVG